MSYAAEKTIKIIRFYQTYISPDKGIIKTPFLVGNCKFYPSCSEYMEQAVQKKGLIKGIIKSFWRILRCNPFSKGGYDPT